MRVCLVFAILLSASLARAGDDIVFVSDASRPPFATTGADGEIVGLDRDIASALCRVLAASCRFARAGWAEMVAGLADGRFDVGFSGISQATAATLGLATTQPYLGLASRFVGHAGGAAPRTLDDLAGFTVGALWGTPHARWLESHLPAGHIQRYPDAEEMYLSLRAGRIDLVFGDGLTLEQRLLTGPLGTGLAFVGPPVDLSGGSDTGLVFLVGRKDGLRQRLDAALAGLERDGILARLRETWLPGYGSP